MTMSDDAIGAGLSARQLEALLRSDFATFVQATFTEVSPGVKLIWAPYLDLICALLADVAHGRRRNLILTVPPRHLKSFCVSVALPAFILGHYPSQEVMCVSYGQELARKFAEDCLTIMKSDLFVSLFGDLLTRKRQPAHLIRTRGGGARRATSLDGTATGVGGDVLIFDDPQKPGETYSDAVRRSTNEAYEQTFLSRRNDPGTGRMIIVMQRLHEDDFVSHVQGLGGDWELVNLPAIAEEDEDISYETFLGPHRFRRRAGEPLHPIRVPLSELHVLRAALGDAVFATQYQQRPAPAGGGLVQTGWFKRYLDADLPTSFDRIIQSWDTANTVQEWSDYSVCTTWGVKGKHVYLLHVFRARLDYPDLRRAVIRQASLHGAEAVFIEDRASGTQLLQELRADNFGKGRAVKPAKDKQTRMINQTALIENGFVHIPADASWLAEYLHELAMFPNGKYDDQVDSTSQALEAAGDWSDGAGLLEYYRLEAAKTQALAEEVWILRPPPDCSLLLGREGSEYRLQPDGCFHVSRPDGLAMIGKIGWSHVGEVAAA